MLKGNVRKLSYVGYLCGILLTLSNSDEMDVEIAGKGKFISRKRLENRKLKSLFLNF